MKIFTLEFWITVDKWLNKKVLNGQDETISDRMGENLLEGKKGCCNFQYHLCKLLSWLERIFTNRKDKVRHCIESIEEID